VTLQIVRDWVIRFNARGAEGLPDGKAPGKPSILNDAQRRALVEIVERGPIAPLTLPALSPSMQYPMLIALKRKARISVRSLLSLIPPPPASDGILG